MRTRIYAAPAVKGWGLTAGPDYFQFFIFLLSHWVALPPFKQIWHRSKRNKNRWPPFCQIWIIFTRLRFWPSNIRTFWAPVQINYHARVFCKINPADVRRWFNVGLILGMVANDVRPVLTLVLQNCFLQSGIFSAISSFKRQKYLYL